MAALQPIRGTRDISGDELLIHNFIIQKAREISQNYNFEEIATPIFETSEVFNRTLGETSDIVSKETYTFQDRDGSYITLRPEFTAGVVRSAISNSLLQSMPRRYFSAGAVFRHERPQKCRYRQFHQLNFEIFGSSEPTADVECIMLAWDILKSLGLQDEITLELSTLGDFESRAAYREKLVEYFSRYKEDLSEDSLIRLEKNPLRILDSKDEGDKKIVADAPKIFDALNVESQERFDKVQNQLNELRVPFTINEKIVRGMDYYCHTVFEFTTQLLGSQGTVLGGGRYDKLFEMMGANTSVPGIGFGCGIERVAELASAHIKAKLNKQPLTILIPIGEKAANSMLMVANKLRSNRIRCDSVIANKVSKQFEKANKMGADYVVVFGDSEIETGELKLKNMKYGTELSLSIDQIICNIKNINRKPPKALHIKKHDHHSSHQNTKKQGHQ